MLEKILPKLLRGYKQTLVFSSGIVSAIGIYMQKIGSKFQGNPRETHEKGQN